MAAVKPQRPLFGFLWPAPRAVPQDGDAVQLTWLRVPPRGPWRLALLIALTALLITAGAAMISALLASMSLPGLLISIVVIVGSALLLGRGWAVGTSVNDTGVKISRLRTTLVVPWADVLDVDQAAQSRWLGLPLQVSGWTVLLRTSEGLLSTHIATSSPDLWGRSQAADAAASTLRTWWRETR